MRLRKKIRELEKEWEKANQDLINYAKELQVKYGEMVARADLTYEEFSKYMQLYKKLKEIWEKLEKSQEKQCRRLYDKGGM